jgi:hypothetical protein
MAEEIGEAFGLALEDYAIGIRLVESAGLDEVNRRREQAARASESARDEHARAAAAYEDLEDRWKQRVALVAGREATRRRTPSDFSSIRGGMYLGISILLLLADFTLLGQVLARFLGLKWSDQDGVSFAIAFLRNPIGAYREHPELMLLTLGILVLGMSGKLLRDTYLSARTGNAEATPNRLEFYASFVLCVLAMATLTAVSAVRLSLPLGEVDNSFSRAVSALLGLVLPLLSAGFFIKGYDQIANGFSLALEKALCRLEQVRLRKRSRHVRHLEGAVARTTAAQTELDSADFAQSVIHKQRLAFEIGYRRGLDRLLPAGTRGLYARLQPILLRRVLSQRSTRGTTDG